MNNLLLIVLACLFELTLPESKNFYDVIFKGGRVYDPETGLNEILNVAIKDDKIIKISKSELKGQKVIDIRGLALSPGFIDLNARVKTLKENTFQIYDGVTTALSLEGGSEPVESYIKIRVDSSLVNFGTSVNHGRLRELSRKKYDFRKITDNYSQNYSEVFDSFLVDLKRNIIDELAKGCLAIGVPVGYYPDASRREIYEIYKLAGELSVPVFSHVREAKAMAVQQAVADAVSTGAPLHIVHLNSSCRDEIGLALEIIQSLQKKGFDITTDIYPYTAASTGISTSIFEAGWEERLGITYNDLQWVATGERLTKETFEVYHKKGGGIIIHMMRPEWIREGIESPVTMIASDGLPYSKLAHPRTAGTFSRVLGKYVREEKALTLMEALAKMTIMPAKRLEKITPDMKMRGRIQVGCYADITVFDPGTIIDKATFEGGLEFSEGIKYVMVNGTLVISDSRAVRGVYPGRPVLSKIK